MNSKYLGRCGSFRTFKFTFPLFNNIPRFLIFQFLTHIHFIKLQQLNYKNIDSITLSLIPVTCLTNGIVETAI